MQDICLNSLPTYHCVWNNLWFLVSSFNTHLEIKRTKVLKWRYRPITVYTDIIIRRAFLLFKNVFYITCFQSTVLDPLFLLPFCWTPIVNASCQTYKMIKPANLSQRLLVPRTVLMAINNHNNYYHLAWHCKVLCCQ